MKTDKTVLISEAAQNSYFSLPTISNNNMADMRTNEVEGPQNVAS
jgi:hypothetical protein